MAIKRAKKCRVCRAEFMPMSSLARVCSVPCAVADVRKTKTRLFRQETRERKRAIKTQGQWVQEVQVEFNKFIRARDARNPCISCGRSSGAKVNAGHYRPTSTAPELRFNEINCYLQCEHCNTFKSANLVEYRVALVKKIGEPLVLWLEGPHKPLKPTIEELQWLKKYYKQRAREAAQYNSEGI